MNQSSEKFDKTKKDFDADLDRLAGELRAYIDANFKNDKEFAELSGIATNTLSPFLSRKVKTPGLDFFLKLIQNTAFRPWFMEKPEAVSGPTYEEISEAAFLVLKTSSAMRQQPEDLGKAQWVADMAIQLAEDRRRGTKGKAQKFLMHLEEEGRPRPASEPPAPRKK